MGLETYILDDVYNYCNRYIVYPSEQARVAHTLWIVGSYFLETSDIPVFDNYPILAFLSPDEDSGKSRALDVTAALAYSAIDGGSYTAASLCQEIDEIWPKMITMVLDELDETLGPNQDNAPFVRLLNNGYQRGKVIVRRHLTEQKNIKTQAYCPKAVAGLTVTKLKRTTRSRMIIVRMRPMRKGEKVERHLDKIKAHELSELIKAWRPTIFERLKAIDEDSLSKLNNRAAQIWHPLLAIAKIAGGDDWFRRASDAAQYFTSKQKPEDNLGKKLLRALYLVYLSGKHPKGIWGETFAAELWQQHGFSGEIDKHKIAYCLGANGYGIPTSQIKIKGENKNGYIWEDCIPFFADHLTEDERNEIADTLKSAAPASTGYLPFSTSPTMVQSQGW